LINALYTFQLRWDTVRIYAHEVSELGHWRAFCQRTTVLEYRSRW